MSLQVNKSVCVRNPLSAEIVLGSRFDGCCKFKRGVGKCTGQRKGSLSQWQGTGRPVDVQAPQTQQTGHVFSVYGLLRPSLTQGANIATVL